MPGCLYILVEGPSDTRFFEGIVKPLLLEFFDMVKIIETSHKKNKEIRSLIYGIKDMGAEYLYVVDIDEIPCVTKKKERVKEKIQNIDEERIVVVKKEIESWYLAGLGEDACRRFKITHVGDTQNVNKEMFNGMLPSGFNSIVNFMIEITRTYCLESAKSRNASFEYFYKLHIEGMRSG
jgi:hypothetical protein